MVNELGAMLWSMKGWFIVGAAVMAFGGIVLLASRKAGPDSWRTGRWIGFPLLGCGGCLFVYPFFALSGMLLMLLGVITVCKQVSGC
ncbi:MULTISPECIES: hypothetical protein [unclassified Novosphingobium]|uniref:hypothetical protein n=1 Tax=unclassified Novosphingobium TaxID=2644732 RepID=UPI0025F57095|nr:MULTISPECIES: hypothetical protein [unclassified Novosphingobium]HQV04604.1 hypothetical protein [Novosphingobium sp.]